MIETNIPVIDSEFLSNLRCPICRGTFDVNSNNQPLHCSECDRQFPIREGIPDLFVRWTMPGASHRFESYIVSAEKLVGYANGNGTTKPVPLFHPETRPENAYKIAFVTWRLLFDTVLLIGLIQVVRQHQGNGLAILGLSGLLADWLTLHFLLTRSHRKELSTLATLAAQTSLHEKDIKDPLSDADWPDLHITPHNRRDKIVEALAPIDLRNRIALHIGCGGEQDREVMDIYAEKGARLWGIDIYLPSLKWFRSTYQGGVALAEALHLPFSDHSVDFVNCTDILEHVHDPFRLLQEAFRVLKPGGRIFLITPNRCRIRRHLGALNPLIALQSAVGMRVRWILPQREMLAKHRNYNFFHTSFSPTELRNLVNVAGFSIEQLEIRAYRGPGASVRKFLEGVPLLEALNDSLFLIAQKPGSEELKSKPTSGFRRLSLLGYMIFWLPVVLWCALMFYPSTIPYLKAAQAGWEDLLLRKIAHLIEYGILARLFARALRGTVSWPWKRIFIGALVLTTLYGATDEYHQTFVPGRNGCVHDVVIDSIAGLIALGLQP